MKARSRRGFGSCLWMAGAVALTCAASPLSAQVPDGQRPAQLVEPFRSGASRVVLAVPAGFVQIDFWSDRAVRVRYGKQADWAGNANPAIVGAPERTQWNATDMAEAHIFTSSALQVQVSKRDGAVSFHRPDGKPITGEADNDLRHIDYALPRNGKIEQRFEASGDEAFYGLGQHQNGRLDQRGRLVRLQQTNGDVGVPMLVSSAGYGILWNNASVTEIDLGMPQASSRLVFRSEAGSGVDYHFFYGPDLDQVIAGYRAVTGDAPLMARWTWGLWQSKERYQTQEELVGIAERYRAMRVPIDVVVQDWQYWQPGQWGSHQFDPKRYPDPKAMIARLRALDMHTAISVWPRFDIGTANLAALDAAGAAYPRVYRNVYPAGEGRWYDPFSARGRALYWRQISDALGRIGFDAWWLDASEAELGGRWGEMRDVTTGAGPGAELYNAYPLMHTSAVHDGARADYPGKRPVILTRSAFAGQQRNAAITWSGDIHGSWDVLKAQVPAALNFSLSGIPYWSSDTGGFFGGEPRDPAYAELFTRWLQFAVFTPMFRIHGTGPGKEIWAFDAGVQPNLVDAVRLRYRLLPYIYSLSWQITDRRATMMRPLVMDFAGDREARLSDDQYMFGPAFLVSPVLEKAVATRRVQLPGDADWYDFWTGARLRPGVMDADTPIGHIPLHVRAGTILPLGPVVQHSGERPDAPLEIRVYRGRNGSFELYEDEGDGQGYRAGARSVIRFNLDDASGVLTIGRREGRYKRMPAKRVFRVVGVAPGRGIGLGEAGEGDGVVVAYSGAPVTVPLASE